MSPPSWGELTALLLALGGGVGWWERRRGTITDLERQVANLEGKLETAMAEAEKALRSHEETTEALKAEIAEWRRQVDRRDDRITELEDQRLERWRP